MQLNPHQISGGEWLAERQYALLADEMRVGKTLTAIHGAILKGCKNILIACPAIARDNWAQSILEHTSHRARVITSQHQQPAEFGVTVASYNLIDEKFVRPWDLLIPDESHFLKSLDSKRTTNLFGPKGVAHQAKNVWMLSGTPAPNDVSEMWVSLFVFGVTQLSYDEFVERYCEWKHTPYGLKIIGNKNVPEFKQLIKNFVLRRTLKEVAPELKGTQYSSYYLPEMTEADKRFMMENFPDEVSILESAVYSDFPMENLSANTESTSTLRRWIGNLKVKSFAEYLDIMSYDKLVVFGVHRTTLKPLAELLGDEAVLVYGGMSHNQKKAAIERFQNDETCRYFIGNLTAAGTNLDLSVADYVILLESSWVPSDNQQAILRITNINDTKPKFAQFMGFANSIDGVVQSVACRKTKMLTEIFD